jgi:hypothetical protein
MAKQLIFLFTLCFVQTFGQIPAWKKDNWLVNPGAEVNPLDYWAKGWESNYHNTNTDYQPNGNISEYGRTSGEWKFGCDASCGLPPQAGQSYFRIDQQSLVGTTTSEIFQTIDLSPLSYWITKDSLWASFSGWVAGGNNKDIPDDHVQMWIYLLDKEGRILSEKKEERKAADLTALDENQREENGFVRLHKFEPFQIRLKVPKEAQKTRVVLRKVFHCPEGKEVEERGVSGDCVGNAYFFDVLRVHFYPSGKE